MIVKLKMCATGKILGKCMSKKYWRFFSNIWSEENLEMTVPELD